MFAASHSCGGHHDADCGIDDIRFVFATPTPVWATASNVSD
jgi:hypothetical protein